MSFFDYNQTPQADSACGHKQPMATTLDVAPDKGITTRRCEECGDELYVGRYRWEIVGTTPEHNA